MATYELREAVNTSAEQFRPDVDEFEMAGLTKNAGNARASVDGRGISHRY